MKRPTVIDKAAIKVFREPAMSMAESNGLTSSLLGTAVFNYAAVDLGDLARAKRQAVFIDRRSQAPRAAWGGCRNTL
jgi:hypothetical protein